MDFLKWNFAELATERPQILLQMWSVRGEIYRARLAGDIVRELIQSSAAFAKVIEGSSGSYMVSCPALPPAAERPPAA